MKPCCKKEVEAERKRILEKVRELKANAIDEPTDEYSAGKVVAFESLEELLEG